MNLDSFTGMQIRFYMEGSLCNQLQFSPFWEQMKTWQFKILGFTLEQSTEKWEKIKPIIIEKTKSTFDSMIQRIDDNQVNDPDQLGLFG